MVIVTIALATICFIAQGQEHQQCYPALIGGDTPRGEYQLEQRLVTSQGYGGDVLQFKEDTRSVYAIHRLWLLRPWEHREKRIRSKDPKVRRITKGCVNVESAVYDLLVDCCSTDVLLIR